MTDRTGTTVCSHNTPTDEHCILCCGKFEDCNRCMSKLEKVENDKKSRRQDEEVRKGG